MFKSSEGFLLQKLLFLFKNKCYIEYKGFTFLIAPGPKRDVYSLFAKAYISRNYLIDKNGKIAYQSIGYKQEEFEDLKEKITQLLDQN